jgi:hypothetical protein
VVDLWAHAEGLLAELACLREQVEGAPAERRAELLRQHAEVRALALRYRWYLVVQREANGLHGEAEVERRYPIPPPCDVEAAVLAVRR